MGLVLIPDLCIKSAIEGIKVCMSTVVPALFPFFVCSKMLLNNGFISSIGTPFSALMRPVFNVPGCGAFAFLVGVLSGCPVGAKTVIDMYEKSMCTKAEAQRMLCFCNNSGPLFIIGSVATSMLGFKEIGTTLYISHILSAIIIGIAVSRYGRREKITRNYFVKNIDSKEVSFGDIIKESVSLTGYVCGFVVFFAVAIGLLKNSGITDVITQRFSGGSCISGIIFGMCEMTNGISIISQSKITMVMLLAISFILGFGGLSVILQVYGIIKKHGFLITMFSVAKLFQGIISALITYIIIEYSNITLPVFSANYNFGILNTLAFSINIFAIFGIIILFLSILYIVCKILRCM